MKKFRILNFQNRGWNPSHQKEAYLFLIPSLIGFSSFVIIPTIISLALSFTEWDLIRPAKFVGLENYIELLTADRIFFKVVSNTIVYVILIVPVQLLLGLVLAVALNQSIRGILWYRLIIFMPVITNIVAVAIVFQFFLNRDFGIVSGWIWQIADETGWPIAPPDWLNSQELSKGAVSILTVWKNVGFSMVIYLAALQAVPESLYEAARLDGAGNWQRFYYVTIPMVSPTTFFLLIIQMIGAFQLFAEPYVLTDGGPAQSSLSVVQYIYQNAFEYGMMGKAAAIAWLLFLVILFITLIQTWFQKRWVHYES
jgi:multiple sugar transport system permease protein